MKKRFPVLLVALLMAAGAAIWWKYAGSPVNPRDTTARTFIIARGDDVRQIANKLWQQNLIHDPVSFFLLIKRLGIEKNIQAGSFHLAPSMSEAEIAQKLTLGTEDMWITFPEGWRSEQILDYLQSQKIDDGNWDMATEVKQWQPSEGKYFPETYLVPKLITVSGVRALMNQTFNERFTQQLQTDAQAANLTPEQVVILASLVEREAKYPADRPIVARVLLNRLVAGMALDVDATVQYAVGYTAADGWWKKELAIDDLKIKSPYNTYTNPGLPPGPICNPGLSAIKAVVYPDKNNYLFYLTGNDGQMHYARTLEEHNQNVAKYL